MIYDDEKQTNEAYSHIDLHEVRQEWENASQARDRYTTDFPSLDNLVDGVPLDKQEDAPYVGDTTMSGLVRSIPKASLQQLPIFSSVVNGNKNSIDSHIASYLLRLAVFNKDTFGKGLLSTLQIGTEKAVTHGFAPFMTSTGMMFDNFGTSMKLLHYSDVAPEPGIQDASESGYFYVTANLTKTRVRKIYRAALRNEHTTWNVDALKRLLDSEPDSDNNYVKYMSESDAGSGIDNNRNTYKFVTKYEVGPGGEFITFSPQIEDEPLRVVENRSKFGYPRVQFLVIDPAPLSPYGTSRVRLASPNQNLMNVYYQNIAKMLLINSDPPILQRGRFSSQPRLTPRSRWVAMDNNATAELVNMDNGSLSQFVPMSNQMSTQIKNIMGTPTAESSNAEYSGTGPGVRLQERDLTMHANQITKILENFLRQYALVALDTYVSEQSGSDVLIVDEEAKNAINRIEPDYIGDDNKIQINWDDFYDRIEHWTVEIDVSVGQDELEERERGDLQDAITVLGQNADVLGPEAQKRTMELTDMLLENSVPNAKRLRGEAAEQDIQAEMQGRPQPGTGSQQIPPEMQQMLTDGMPR